MTSPAPSGGSSPLRVGGLALLGVGAVAGLIGIASLVGGGGGDSTTAAAPPPTSAAAPADPNAPAPGAPTPDPNAAPAPGATPAPGAAPTPAAPAPAPGGVPVPSFGATPNALAAPSKAAPAPSARAAAKLPVRVYNNSTITGLATRAADDLRAKGWPVESVANYSQGVIPTSTVYFRPGTSEEASAQALGKAVGARVEPRFAGLNDASAGLILIVTNDYKA